MNTSIHDKHHTEGQHPTTDETQTKNTNDIHPASPGCRPGTYPQIDEEEELQSKQASLSRQDIALPVPATVVVVICEPRGLSNTITMGSKTIKA